LSLANTLAYFVGDEEKKVLITSTLERYLRRLYNDVRQASTSYLVDVFVVGIVDAASETIEVSKLFFLRLPTLRLNKLGCLSAILLSDKSNILRLCQGLILKLFKAVIFVI
jgi:hypothetical protein